MRVTGGKAHLAPHRVGLEALGRAVSAKNTRVSELFVALGAFLEMQMLAFVAKLAVSVLAEELALLLWLLPVDLDAEIVVSESVSVKLLLGVVSILGLVEGDIAKGVPLSNVNPARTEFFEQINHLPIVDTLNVIDSENYFWHDYLFILNY